MTQPTFCWESVLNHSQHEVFAWHTRHGAFERFNPPWRPVKVIKAPESLLDGSLVRISLPVLGPIRLTWSLAHREYQENAQFCDEQVQGPFRQWKHLHKFLSEGTSSCRMRDEIYFKLPRGLGVLTPFVRWELGRLFRFRHMVLKQDLALQSRWKDAPRKRILVSGSSGFIGSALTAFLSTAGHSVIRLVRRPTKSSDERSWDPEQGVLDPSVFQGIDVVIHLGGEGLLTKRWTEAFKRRIVESRVKSSSLLTQTIAKLSKKPEVVIMASAIGIYGDTGSTLTDETSLLGSGFLPDTCKEWEKSSQDGLTSLTRVVLLRIGTVLNARGGALQKMLLPFKLGVGGQLGAGSHYMSWIALQDLLGIIEHIIFTPSIAGAVNAVAPEPVTNQEFTKTLGKVVHRPTIIPTPAPLLKLLFGEVAEAALLSSLRVYPKVLIDNGYLFQFPHLYEALCFECGISDK